MPKDTAELKTVDLSGIEIFASGTWNGSEYTDADLDAMVSAFSDLKGRLDPPVKLGHDDKQKLLQADGYPAAGWVSRLARKGDKLIADLRDVPARVAELIKAGAYKKISSEIYWDFKADNGKKYRRVLKAIALLGADIPAVSSIGDIRALYGSDNAVIGYYDDEGREVEVVEFAESGPPVVTLEELEADLDSLMGNAESVVKGKTGAPALRAFLREIKAKLRRMMGGSMPMPKPKAMPEDDMPDDGKPKRHSMALFKTEAGYRSAGSTDVACASCRMYQEPYGGPMDEMGRVKPGGCRLVEGSILPAGTCDHAAAMPMMPGADDETEGMAAHAATKQGSDESCPQTEEDTMSEEQYTELQGRVETLTKRLETAEAAAKDAAGKVTAAEQEAKTYAERVAKLEGDLQLERDARQYTDILQTARRWAHVPGKPEEIASRLQKLAKLDPDEYTARVAEYDQMEQFAVQSGLFSETGSSRADEGGSAEAKLDRMARARATEQKIDYGAALAQVAAENPELHRQYTRETAVKV